MSDNQAAPPDGLSGLLASITENPEVMEKIAAVVGEPSDNTPKNVGEVLGNSDLMSKLPEVMAILRPLVTESRDAPPPKKDGKNDAAGRRMALLFALKPYLSPRRCEAIDYMARIGKLGDLLKHLQL